MRFVARREFGVKFSVSVDLCASSSKNSSRMSRLSDSNKLKQSRAAAVLATAALPACGLFLSFVSVLSASLFGTTATAGQWISLWIAGFSIVTVACLWFSLIAWTRARVLVFAALSCLPLVQPVVLASLWGRSRWSRGFTSDIEQVTLTLTAIGVYGLALAALTARWTQDSTGEVGNMTEQESQSRVSVLRALLISIALQPAGLAMFLLGVIASDELFNVQGEAMLLLVAYGFAFAVCVPIWIWAWMRALPKAARASRTFSIGVMATIAPPLAVLLAFVLFGSRSPRDAFLLGLLPLAGWCAWMALTVRAVRRADVVGYVESNGPACPSCGYPLVGLTSTRCPECGSEPTLDELWAAHSSPI